MTSYAAAEEALAALYRHDLTCPHCGRPTPHPLDTHRALIPEGDTAHILAYEAFTATIGDEIARLEEVRQASPEARWIRYMIRELLEDAAGLYDFLPGWRAQQRLWNAADEIAEDLKQTR